MTAGSVRGNGRPAPDKKFDMRESRIRLKFWSSFFKSLQGAGRRPAACFIAKKAQEGRQNSPVDCFSVGNPRKGFPDAALSGISFAQIYKAPGFYRHFKASARESGRRLSLLKNWCGKKSCTNQKFWSSFFKSLWGLGGNPKRADIHQKA